jgi:hypothetical protein
MSPSVKPLLLALAGTAAAAAATSNETDSTVNDADFMDRFYSAGSLVDWETVLGPAFHYHHGLFQEPELQSQEIDDDQADVAMDRAIRVLYPFIAGASTVIDIGCGWCGPLAQLEKDLGSQVTGVTISAGQADFCRGRGHVAVHADANTLFTGRHRRLPELDGKRFDVALLVESFSHIRNKSGLLTELHDRADKLVMRVNTYDGANPGRAVFGGSMQLPSTAELIQQVEAAGWRIVHSGDLRRTTRPTMLVYSQRIARLARPWCVLAASAGPAPSSMCSRTVFSLAKSAQHARRASPSGGGWSTTASLTSSQCQLRPPLSPRRRQTPQLRAPARSSKLVAGCVSSSGRPQRLTCLRGSPLRNLVVRH